MNNIRELYKRIDMLFGHLIRIFIEIGIIVFSIAFVGGINETNQEKVDWNFQKQKVIQNSLSDIDQTSIIGQLIAASIVFLATSMYFLASSGYSIGLTMPFASDFSPIIAIIFFIIAFMIMIPIFFQTVFFISFRLFKKIEARFYA